MYPHERSLVKKLADKPFVLVGVNSDNDLNELKKVLQDEQITWRSFQNQRGSKDAPAISSDWNISGWPTLYIIDHKGVIRHKFVGSPGDKKLDEIIDTLLKETKEEKKDGP
jgi:thioredoxin family protein